eukprot:TRINITY_DN3762_c1_g1_i1.p1 TRINITY_DN3762_c1_g1~~TRINITY_DN3762_c1_g1_i1.p1  ORF type:complete len:212 (-),score=4.11 TRINITY_DN3762_c1_g1_i1:77-712(-)
MLLYPSFFCVFCRSVCNIQVWSEILLVNSFFLVLFVNAQRCFIWHIYIGNIWDMQQREVRCCRNFIISIFVVIHVCQVFFVASIANLKKFLHIFYQQLGQGYFQVVDLFNPINSNGPTKIFHGSSCEEETVFCCEEETVFCCEGLIIVRYHVNLICISRYQTLAAEDNFVCLQYFVVWMRVILHYRNYLGFQPFFLIFVLVFVHAIFFGVI